ncbi:Retrovirus-related Pol polyprotein from transposon 412 [Eumeta japonica]|uniref:Retrovirus-related Pol polyprotein from transposon 412 n=1 Tax=Eumeta variegata TaxID=151549 RepID=A0A4C1ZF73_EUMVA|nr:Retrovirus-related Pol polyprotein from transposon 412 [Eumeta japonica]
MVNTGSHYPATDVKDTALRSRQLQKLLSEVELGDQRPSRLLRRMRDLVRTKIPDNTLRVMWTGHLPTAVRAVLAVSDTKDLDNLAAVADKIIENTRPLVDVNEVTLSMNHAPSASHKSEADVDRIVEVISKLSMVVKRMGRTQPSWHETHGQRSQSRTPSRSRRTAVGQEPAERQPRHCRTKARKCNHATGHRKRKTIQTKRETPSHSVVHHIEITGPPVFVKARPLQPDRYRRAKEEFQTMMDMGICRPSKSPRASPLHVVPKKDGQIRPWGDYRRLNAVTKSDRSHLPKAAEYQEILNKHIHGVNKKDKTPIDWTPNDERACEKCKVSLQSAVTSDASNTAVGAVLQQFLNNSSQPLGFYSNKLSDTQQKYSAYDRELLAIYMVIKHFRNQIEGRQLTIYTDHKPITYAFAKIGTDSETPRRNAVADALARVDEITCPTTINFEELSAAQSDDATLTHLLQDTDSSAKLKRIFYLPVKLPLFVISLQKR